MINYYSVELLYELFESVFSVAINKKIRFETLEKLIVDSKVTELLEKGDDSFLQRYTIDELLEQIYGLKIDENDLLNHYTNAKWIAEAYINLFLKYSKSFEYLFLYINIEKMFELFVFYHEQDISQLYVYFETVTKKKSLLSMLRKKASLTNFEISSITGISVNTLEKYSKKDEYIYKASFENIYLLSVVFGVRPNIFAKKLLIDTYEIENNVNSNLFDSLGLFYLTFYDKKYLKGDFKFDKENKRYVFTNIENKYFLVIKDKKDIPPYLEIDKNTIVVAFLSNQAVSEKRFEDFENVLIVDGGELRIYKSNKKITINNEILSIVKSTLSKK